MKARIEELIGAYEVRIKARKALERLYGKTQTEAIIRELQWVVQDLKRILNNQ